MCQPLWKVVRFDSEVGLRGYLDHLVQVLLKGLSITGPRLERPSCDLCPGNTNNNKFQVFLFLVLAHHDGGKETRRHAVRCSSLLDKEGYCG